MAIEVATAPDFHLHFRGKKGIDGRTIFGYNGEKYSLKKYFRKKIEEAIKRTVCVCKLVRVF